MGLVRALDRKSQAAARLGREMALLRNSSVGAGGSGSRTTKEVETKLQGKRLWVRVMDELEQVVSAMPPPRATPPLLYMWKAGQPGQPDMHRVWFWSYFLTRPKVSD